MAVFSPKKRSVKRADGLRRNKVKINASLYHFIAVSGLLRRPLRWPEWLSWELQQQSSVNRGRTRHLGLGGICRGCDRTRAGGVLRHNGLTRVGDRVRGGSGEIGGGKKISTRRATH
ncbi:unnamed protein product [Rotaria socialis]|uniref:Uncharacterized protein n=1 Tax=Rotaria socialis TaxID=392032 RepID=A0A817PSA5_9BILA|nr:unnamed protein product [Rotaria socialis]